MRGGDRGGGGGGEELISGSLGYYDSQLNILKVHVTLG